MLKYDVHCSTEEVTFLDCKAKISNRGIETLKDILCNSDVTNRMEPDESKTRNRPCYHGSCLLCTSFGKSNLVINKQKDGKLQVKNGGTCQTKNSIYSAEC